MTSASAFSPVGTQPLVGKGKLPAPTKYILIGYRTPERTQPDRLAQDLTHYLLFNESTSLVGKRLRDEKPWNPRKDLG